MITSFRRPEASAVPVNAATVDASQGIARFLGNQTLQAPEFEHDYAIGLQLIPVAAATITFSVASTAFTISITAQGRLTVTGSTFTADKNLLDKGIELVMHKSDKLRLYMNGYQIHSAAVQEGAAKIQLNSTNVLVKSMYARPGEPVHNWRAVPARYAVTFPGIAHYTASSEQDVSGRLSVLREREFEPYAHLSARYGFGDVDSRFADERLFKEGRSEIRTGVTDIRVDVSRRNVVESIAYEEL